MNEINVEIPQSDDVKAILSDVQIDSFGEYASDILSQDGSLSLAAHVIVECEGGCGFQFENPVIVLDNSVATRDSAVVCKENCID